MPGDREPGGFGSRLREARERRGISLRQIANATKISVSVLEALERNDISRLPGGIFSRAFVRSYASEVGLDPERTVHEFIDAFPEAPVAVGHPAAPIEDAESLESDRRTATTFLQLIALSIPVAAAIWFFGTSGSGVTAPPESGSVAVVEPSTPPASATARSELETPAPAEQKRTLVPSSPPVATPRAVPAANPDPSRQTPPEPAPADRLTVGLAVVRPCWISLTVDGEKAIERLLRPGDQRTLDVRREMVLTAGDAAAVALTLNGAAARPLGRAGQVVTARLDLANFKDYLRVP